MRIWLNLAAVLLGVFAIAQEKANKGPLYLEDQFYFGVSYNFIRNRPEGLAQRNLSYGLYTGFIKDLPLDKGSTKAIGLGMGLALNTYYSNLVVSRDGNTGFKYSLDDGTLDIRRSKLETHLLEFPIEFRWRGSTLEEYRFWRLYAGLKLAYVLGARSKYVTPDIKNGFFNTDVLNFQYGLTLNVGYNTYNIHIYYALNDLFGNEVLVNDMPLGFRPLRVGLIFYIL